MFIEDELFVFQGDLMVGKLVSMGKNFSRRKTITSNFVVQSSCDNGKIAF